ASLRHLGKHLALTRREPGEGIVLSASADEQRDDLGVERRTAFSDAPHGGRELGDVGDAVLEEVPYALRAVGEEVERVLGLDVLREDEHARVRVLLADLACGAEA